MFSPASFVNLLYDEYINNDVKTKSRHLPRDDSFTKDRI